MVVEQQKPSSAPSSSIVNAADEDSFEALFSQTEKAVQEEEVVVGRVLQILKDHVLVDVGHKSEGLIPIDEFLDHDGNLTVNPGDKVEVYLEAAEDEDGLVVLSKEKADQLRVWDRISDAFDKGEPVPGKIVARIKGGLRVDIGVQAFLPGSQVDLRPVRNLDEEIGKTYQFKVLKFNKRRGNIVVSRRALLESQREAMRSQTLERIEENKIMDGVVKNITDYGAFIDLGGIDGLLHVTDMSWGRVNHPNEVFKVGDQVKVKVLKFDRERGRVSLGYKQTMEDPWTSAPDRYPPGTRVKGKVVSLTDYGAFIELEKGVEGLVHVSEMSWTKKVKHPSKIVEVGQEVEAQVLDVDVANQRISLGLKQIMPNPWDLVEERYPIGTVIHGKIKNVTDFGIFIGLDEGIDGLVHISDLSRKKRFGHPSEVYQKGQEVEAVVLHIDRDNERFSLGIKQLEPDPWTEIPRKYSIGSTVSGPVTGITDFGVFVEIEEGVEGLIHISELGVDRSESIAKVVSVGQVVEAVITNLDPVERKIGLSVKSLEAAKTREELERIRAAQPPPPTAMAAAFERASSGGSDSGTNE